MSQPPRSKMDSTVVLRDPKALAALVLPQSPVALVALAVVIAALAYAAFPSARWRAVAHLPRPRGLPFIGNTLDAMFTYRKTLHTWLYHECAKMNGQPFVIDIATKPPIVILSTVEATEDVLKTHFDRFGKGEDFAAALEDLFGRGIFVSDGARWQHQRKTASHMFSMQMMRDIMDAVMVEFTERLCKVVDTAAREERALDFKHLFELYTTDVFTKIGFGVDLDFMNREDHEFFERFGRANHMMLYRNEQPRIVWRLQQWLNIGVEKQQKEDIAYLDQFVYKVVQDSIARKRERGATVEASQKDLITLFLDNPANQTGGDDSGSYDIAEIRDMVIAFLSAGRDTTAYAMAWFIIMMSQHPTVLARIREELWDKLPELMRGEVVAPGKEQVADLTYLEATIKENLRLNTVLPLNTRESTEDVTLSDGTFLRKGTMVLLPAYAMARLPSIWGPDALEFKPERWIDPATGKLMPVSPFKFLTFSAGPRVCLGRNFSILEMKIALAALLSKFDLTTLKDPRTFEYDTSLTLGVEGPILVRPAPLTNSQKA